MDEVFSKLARHPIFEIPNPFNSAEPFQIHNTIVVSWIVMAIVIIIAFIFTRKLSVDKPGKLQSIAEIYVELVRSICKSSIGHHGKDFVTYIGTLLLFLGIANLVGLINFIPGVHLYPPTKDINVTGTFALMSILVVIYSGFRYIGFKGWAKSLIQPIPVIAPFKLMEYGTKPFSLCLRLFSNIFAAFIIMELIYMVAPYAASPLSAYFDVFDGLLQAFIFSYLTTLYIGEAIEV